MHGGLVRARGEPGVGLGESFSERHPRRPPEDARALSASDERVRLLTGALRRELEGRSDAGRREQRVRELEHRRSLARSDVERRSSTLARR